MSFYYVEVGYAAHLPMGGELPDGMSVHNVALRFAVPLRRTRPEPVGAPR